MRRRAKQSLADHLMNDVHNDSDRPSGQNSTATQVAKIEIALRYLARAWSILPLRAHDKRPLIIWEPLQSARPSAEEVVGWFNHWANANIGIVTGEISNLIVIDIDPEHGGDASLDRLELQFGRLPSTIEAITGGEGRHLYFAHPGGLIGNRTGLAQGIDLRGDGGYIAAPPSIHPSGRPYAWAAGRSPEDVTLAALPRWVLLPSGGARARRTLADWRRLVHDRARGSAQFEHRALDRTSAMAPSRPGSDAGIAFRLEPYALSSPA
jgi:hypothetical protein